MAKPTDNVLEVRFAGEALDLHGIPIYELGTAFVAIQRMVHKGHLVQDGRWGSGRSPVRAEKELLALHIGERRTGSDWFALLPVLSDPTALLAIKKAVDYVIGGLTSYALGAVLDRARSEPDESRQVFIGAIYADTVNVVNRIGNIGGCETIEISSPAVRPGEVVTFDVDSRDYVRSLEASPYLGPVQTIEGAVFKLYPNMDMGEMRRPGGKKAKVFLNPDDFALVRYRRSQDPRVRVTGRPRYRVGAVGPAFAEFEATSIVFSEDDEG